MTESLRAGMALILLAGACQGGFMLPSKAMRNWAWENYWLIFATTAYLISPWLLAFATITNLFKIYSGASTSTLAAIATFGCKWGGSYFRIGRRSTWVGTWLCRDSRNQRRLWNCDSVACLVPQRSFGLPYPAAGFFPAADDCWRFHLFTSRTLERVEWLKSRIIQPRTTALLPLRLAFLLRKPGPRFRWPNHCSCVEFRRGR